MRLPVAEIHRRPFAQTEDVMKPFTLSSPRLKERELRCVSKVENKAVCIRRYGGHGVSEKTTYN